MTTILAPFESAEFKELVRRRDYARVNYLLAIQITVGDRTAARAELDQATFSLDEFVRPFDRRRKKRAPAY